MSVSQKEVEDEGFAKIGSTPHHEEWKSARFQAFLYKVGDSFFVKWDKGATEVLSRDHLLNIMRILHA